MNKELFEQLVSKIREASMDTLLAKNAMYATDDKLHNFRVGGDIMGGTAAQACWGYLTKHLVALRDKVERNDFSDLDDLMEKCIDTINYTVFLWCIGNDENEQHKQIRTNVACKPPVLGLGMSDKEREEYGPAKTMSGPSDVGELQFLKANEYQELALRTLNQELSIREVLNDGALGLNGESGECADIVKKHLFQGHDLDKKHLAKELGDVAWYLAVTAYAIGYKLEDVLAMNVAKLQERYPEGFDEYRSRNRRTGDV